jgi:hypothetical protein
MVKEDVYSNKDSNHNRKLEQIKNFHLKALMVIGLTLFTGAFLWYYCNVMERPSIYREVTPPSEPVRVPPANSRNDESHPYVTDLPPYQQ